MKITTPRLILGLALLAGVAAEAWQWRPAATIPSHQVAGPGDPLPDLLLPDLAGQSHHLAAAAAGQRLIVNFWATWCGPCLNELPALDQAARRGQVRVLGIAMDRPQAVRDFLATHPLHYPIWLGQLTPPSSSARLDDSGGLLPYSVLVGADGKILARHAGPLSPALWARWLAQPAAP